MNGLSKVFKIIIGTVIGVAITFFLAVSLDVLIIEHVAHPQTLGHPVPVLTLMWFVGLPVIAAISAIISAIIVFVRDKKRK